MTGIYRRENTHPNKWVNLMDKSDCWVKRRENAHPDKWQPASIFRRESNGWNQIYPRTTTKISRTINSGSNVGYKNQANNSWIFDGTARQGKYGSYGVYGGFCDISGMSFTGSGQIVDIESATFSATRNGSGKYSSDQTIRFYRSEQNPRENGSSPFGHVGEFQSTTGGPGSGGRMNNRGFLNWDSGGKANIMDYLNCVNGKQWLHIKSNSSNEYLGMSNISLSTTYWFNSGYRIFTAIKPRFAISLFARVDVKENDIEHGMLIYPGEERMTVNQIIERRQILGLPDIDETNTFNNEELNLLPSNGEYYITKDKFYIKFFNMSENYALYYSFDNIEWLAANFEVNSGMYMTPYSDYINKINLRVVNYKTDELILEISKDIDNGNSDLESTTPII